MVRYEVTCAHEHCHFSQEVVLPGEVGDWQPPDVSDVLSKDGQPLVRHWDGKPLEDAYDAHYQEVHAGRTDPAEPPMCSWALLDG